MLVDTDVLIWHLRGYPQAAQRLDGLSNIVISAMTYLELLQGMRNKDEQSAVEKMFSLRNVTILPLTPSITTRATALMTQLTLSHGLQAGDALIAATALEHKLPLLTGNAKHFVAIPEITIDRFALA